MSQTYTAAACCLRSRETVRYTLALRQLLIASLKMCCPFSYKARNEACQYITCKLSYFSSVSTLHINIVTHNVQSSIDIIMHNVQDQWRIYIQKFPVHDPPNRTKFFHFYICFHRKVPVSEVGAPPPNEGWHLPVGNPGSAPEDSIDIVTHDVQDSIDIVTHDVQDSIDIVTHNVQDSIDIVTHDVQYSIDIVTHDVQYSTDIVTHDVQDSIHIVAHDIQDGILMKVDFHQLLLCFFPHIFKHNDYNVNTVLDMC